MTIDECFQLGYIIKPHGLKGEVDIFIDSDFPENYNKLESVFVDIHDELVPFFVDFLRILGQKATVKFDGVDKIEKSANLKGLTLHLPLSFLPPLKGNQFYYHEVVGYHVIDKNDGDIGAIHQIYNYPNQDLIAVMKDNNEVLIPVNDKIITLVDREDQTIHVTLPSGLLDIYS